MWKKEQLETTLQAKLSDYLLIVASNRQPYSHVIRSKKLVPQRQPGGLVTALDPVMRAAKGTWIAMGASVNDRISLGPDGKVALPPENPAYQLKRLFVSKEDMDAYYYGYSNEGLWPLSHIAYTRPHFLASDWKAYEKVNKAFADSIIEEAQGKPAFVWVQDFHLVLVAKYLREANVSNVITSFFWHIPWPNSEVFRVCPQRKEILEGMLAYDLLGFQIRYHCDNFLAAVDQEMESRIDREKMSVSFQNHETLIRPFPISVDFETISSQTSEESSKKRGRELHEELSGGDKKLVVGVDRIDYTKGIPEKFRAVDRLLEKHPELKEKFVLFQLGQVSRIHIARYKDLNDELNALVEEINWKHSQGSWVPIIFTRSYMPYEDILALYRASEICIVSPLHDGMNLVAKEFVASRSDFQGALILSQFTGSARELTDSIIINPYDTETFADAIHQALIMPPEEQEKRMKKMRETVAANNIYRWAGKVLSQLFKFEFQET